MGKRSNFERVERDFYPTPEEAVVPLIPYLTNKPGVLSFVEPCAGDGALWKHITKLSRRNCHGLLCDIEPQAEGIVQKDALTLTEEDVKDFDYIITNPPWDRKILHPMINHFRTLKPTWLLFDTDWMHTKQSSEYMQYCSMIVSVGRVKWIPDSKMTGKDNCAWYKFGNQKVITNFVGR